MKTVNILNTIASSDIWRIERKVQLKLFDITNPRGDNKINGGDVSTHSGKSSGMRVRSGQTVRCSRSPAGNYRAV